MDYDVVISNGIVVSAEGEARADVAIQGERIAAVGPGLAASARDGTRIVDARGRYVIPGSMCTSTWSSPSAGRSPATTGTRARAPRPAAA